MLDPATYEVLRHRLATIVGEGAAVLRNISGSPSVAQSNDCNVALLTADGEGVVIGRTISSHAISCIQTARYIIAEYRDNPGFGPGDMFFSNHPYIGTPHQTCGVMVAPTYVDGELVAWAGVGIHFGDVGGPVPGQVSVGAQSIWSEAIPIPPVKIVDAGNQRRDLIDAILVNTRTRIQNLVDLKAMIGSNHAIAERVLQVVQRYGKSTFTETLERIIHLSEVKLRSILRDIPDGQWSETTYLDYFDNNEMQVYACRMTLSKTDERLIFDLRGSSRQAPGVVNATFPALEGYLLRAMLGLFGFAISYCAGAISRVTEIVSEEGTNVHCSWPAGVCKGTTSATMSIWQAATSCLSQMLLQSPTYEHRAMAVSRGHLVLLDLSGTDQYGTPFTAVLQDCALAAGSGATAKTDGIDTGGVPEPEPSIPNVESNEFRYPVLYLYRKQTPDSGGAGKYRGGLGLSVAITPHDVEEIPATVLHCHGLALPSAFGLSGGLPGAMNRLTITRKSKLEALFRDGVLPVHMAQAGGATESPPPFCHTYLRAGDIMECRGGGGGGYGDPLDRDPALVLQDVVWRLVSPDAARSQYGVILDATRGTIDDQATTHQRSHLRARRAEEAKRLEPAAASVDSSSNDIVTKLNEYLHVIATPDGHHVQCRCGGIICSASENYREYLARRQVTHTALVIDADCPVTVPPYSITDEYCPYCFTLIGTEVGMKDSTNEEASKGT